MVGILKRILINSLVIRVAILAEFSSATCCDDPEQNCPEGLSLSGCLPGTNYCTWGPDSNCYENGWPSCCSSDVVECPTTRPECELSRITTCSTAYPTEGALCNFEGTCRYNPRACPGETDVNEILYDVCQCDEGNIACTSIPLECPDIRRICPADMPVPYMESCEAKGLKCNYSPFVCRAGSDGPPGFIETCECKVVDEQLTWECIVLNYLCIDSSCPSSRPENGSNCNFEATCRYNPVACSGEADENDIEYDVCECEGGTTICTPHDLECPEPVVPAVTCPENLPETSTDCDIEDLACNYNPFICPTESYGPADFTDSCTCEMDDLGLAWACNREDITCSRADSAVVLGICFPGEALVQVKGRKDLTPMNQLNIGDAVLVENSQYEPIYSFGHKEAHTMTDYLELGTSKTTIVLSGQHMVREASQGFVPASVIKIGDALYHDNAGRQLLVVTSVRNVSKEGRYAPFTPSGTIVVNRIVASSFVAIPNLKPLVENLNFSYQWMAHTGEFPHRLACHYLGSCTNESYSKNGINQGWCTLPSDFFELTSTSQLMWYLLYPALLFALFTFWAMELLIVIFPSFNTLILIFGMSGLAFVGARTCLAVKVKNL